MHYCGEECQGNDLDLLKNFYITLLEHKNNVTTTFREGILFDLKTSHLQEGGDMGIHVYV